MKEEKEELKEQEFLEEKNDDLESKDEVLVNGEETKVDEESDEEKEAYELKISDEERLKLIKEFNEQNKGRAFIYDEKPTQEEKDAAIQEFVKANDDYSRMEFTIADCANSLRVAKFLKNWNENDAVWEKDMWQGTIMFDAIIKDFIERREKDGSLALVVNYGALSYLYIALGSVRGVGLKAALRQQKINEEYDKIFSVVADCVEDFKAKAKEVEKLQQIAQFYTNGYKVRFEEEPKDTHMSKEEFVQNIKDHWDETAELREKVFANPYQFGLTTKEVEELKAYKPQPKEESGEAQDKLTDAVGTLNDTDTTSAE